MRKVLNDFINQIADMPQLEKNFKNILCTHIRL